MRRLKFQFHFRVRVRRPSGQTRPIKSRRCAGTAIQTTEDKIRTVRLRKPMVKTGVAIVGGELLHCLGRPGRSVRNVIKDVGYPPPTLATTGDTCGVIKYHRQAVRGIEPRALTAETPKTRAPVDQGLMFWLRQQ